MLLKISVFICTLVSLIAIQSQAFDFFLGRVPFLLVFISSLLGAGSLIFWEHRKSHFNEKSSTIALVIIITSFIYFLSLSSFSFLPVSKHWDGANHLSIVQFLLEHLGHRPMLESEYGPTWGGGLHTYPWGWHSFIASIAHTFGITPLKLIWPIVALSSSLMLGLWIYYLQFVGLSVLLSHLLILPLGFFLQFAIKFNYWNNIFALFELVVLIIYLKTSLKRNIYLLGLIALSIFFTYPLFIPIVLIGLPIFLYLEKDFSPKEISIFAVILFLSALYILFPTLSAHQQRAMAGNGPTFWINAQTYLIHWVVYLCFGLGLTIQGIYKRQAITIFPALAMIGALSSLVLGMTTYWVSKYLFVSSFLFPIIALASIEYSSKKKIIICAGVVFNILLVVKSFNFKFYSAFSKTEFEIVEHIRNQSEKNGRFYMLTDAYSMSWMEASTYPHKLLMPRNFRSVVTSRGNSLDIAFYQNEFISIGRDVDTLITPHLSLMRPTELLEKRISKKGWSTLVLRGTK